MYVKGIEIEKNYTKAIEYFERSGKPEDLNLLFHFGYAYLNGDNDEKCKKYMR